MASFWLPKPTRLVVLSKLIQTYSFYPRQVTLPSIRHYFVTKFIKYNVHYYYKYKTKKTESILYLKGMQMGVILSG